MTTVHYPDHRFVAPSGPERAQLQGWLDFYRDSLLVKCDGLDEAGLKARPVATSTLSHLGMVRHLTYVETAWFEVRFTGLDVVAPYGRSDDPDSDFVDLDDTPVADVFALFEATRQRVDALVAGRDLDELAAVELPRGFVDLRWIYLHLIEEYARHLGHLDILRELLDGRTGY